MKPKPHQKQANPRDQAVVTLAAAEGLLENLLLGIYGELSDDTWHKVEHVDKWVREAIELLGALPSGKWD
jgi:hypothetical protein